MSPLIRYKKDYVTIIPLEAPPVPGDIVLFADFTRDRYVMHRVWKVRKGEALIWEDNCDRTDGWIPLDKIWGKALQVERGRKTIQMNARRGLLWASFWHKAGRVYRFVFCIKKAVLRRMKNIVF